MRAPATAIAAALLATSCVTKAPEADVAGQGTGALQDEGPRLSDEPRPLATDVPDRTAPIFGLGNPYFGSGPLSPGVEVPTGQVLQPSFQLFGSYRTALQTFGEGSSRVTEWANRLDLSGNLQLSQTERILIGMRPLQEGASYSGYLFEPDAAEGWTDDVNADITTLFFEGDFGEVFPGLDPEDEHAYDYGFSVGRQPLILLDGILINDDVDSLGVTRNTLRPAGFSNLRLTGLFGWNEINREGLPEQGSPLLFGLSGAADFERSSVFLDGIWVEDPDDRTDALYVGGGAVQRFGAYSTAFDAAGSFPEQAESASVGQGGLLMARFSRTFQPTQGLTYLNTYWGIGRFTSAARGPGRGGPLGPVGLLFASPLLGTYPAPLGGRPDSSVGGSLGHQGFLDELRRKQWVVELGGRADTDESDTSAVAAGARYEQALGNHTTWRVDGFVTGREGDSTYSGLRTELHFKF